MKLITTPIILLIAIRFCTFASAPDSKSYHWVRAMNPGVKTWPRWVVPVAGPDEKLRMIDKGKTWLSPDGINWTTVRNNAAQAVRPGAAQTFFGGKFWLMGVETSIGKHAGQPRYSAPRKASRCPRASFLADTGDTPTSNHKGTTFKFCSF